MSVEERVAFRDQFRTSLSTVQHAHVYWSPKARRIFARAVKAVKRHALPEDSVLVGTYLYPFDSETFLGDLEAVMARASGDNNPSAASLLRVGDVVWTPGEKGIARVVAINRDIGEATVEWPDRERAEFRICKLRRMPRAKTAS